MGLIESLDELMKQISKMDRNNSVLQFSIPGKGKFTLVLQEEADQSIKSDVEVNPQLGRMLRESQREYKEGKEMSTKDLLDSFSVEDFK